MELNRYKEKNHKTIGIILFTIVCVFLVVGIILYQTYAIYEVIKDKDLLNGEVDDPGDIYFAFYVEDKIEKEMPQKNAGYIYDEKNSYCGVLGNRDNSISLEFNQDQWNFTVSGLKESRTKCNLHFVKGAYILGKPIKAVTSDDGLYEVIHGDEVINTSDDKGFKQTEWRYAGSDPNNYVTFNNEKWRIIGLVNVMTSDKKVEQRVKIIRDHELGTFIWSETGKNDWTQSSLMKMLNDDYYYSMKGDNNCYQVDSTKNSCDFSQGEMSGLNENARLMIEQEIIWNIDGIKVYNLSELYNDERGVDIMLNNPIDWNRENTKDSLGTSKPELFHAIGLMYLSDYGYATNGGKLGRENCYLEHIGNWNRDSLQTECANNDWLKPVEHYNWTITPLMYEITPDLVVHIGPSGVADNVHSNNPDGVTPVLYLKQNIRIVNNEQDGSKENPYDLMQIN